MRRTSKFKRVAAITLVTGVVSVAGIAYTNANTVSVNKAGAGSEEITGYTVSAIHYDLNATDPQNIDSVDFTLDGLPASTATIKYRLSDTGAWSGDCAHVNGVSTATVTDCAAPTGSTVVNATNLTVVVAD